MDEEPQKHSPEEILDTDRIQNLDTARMALRWALERLHKLEKDKAELLDKAEASDKARAKALDEYAALQRSFSLREGEANQRELYYAKMEEFLSLRLEGKLDLAALAKREVESSRLQEILDQKQLHLEKDYTAKRTALERDYQQLKTALDARYRDEARRAEQALELKRSSLEQEHLSRMAQAHEKEIRVKHEEQSISERESHFRDYYAAQRAQLQGEIKNFRAEVEQQVDFRLEVTQRLLEERHETKEKALSQEKGLLLQELVSLRQKSQESGQRALELEKALAASQEGLRQTLAAVDRQTLVVEEQRKAWQAEKAELLAELLQWKQKTLEQLPALLELKSALAAAEEAARQAQSSAQADALRLEELRKAFETQLSSLTAERDEWRTRTRDHLARLMEAEKRLTLAEDCALQTQGAGERQSSLLEERLSGLRREHEQALEAWGKERQAFARELEQHRVKAQETLPRLLELEQGLAVAQEQAAAAKAAAQRHQAVLESARKGWEEERRALNQEIEKLSSKHWPPESPGSHQSHPGGPPTPRPPQR